MKHYGNKTNITIVNRQKTSTYMQHVGHKDGHTCSIVTVIITWHIVMMRYIN